jgi:DNA-binding XRE family transcriptional regulator
MKLEFIDKCSELAAFEIKEAWELRDKADDFNRGSQENLRQAMKRLRARMGLSANSFGKLCGVTPQYIFALEAGRAKWNDRMILKLEESLRQKEAALASEDLQSGSEA